MTVARIALIALAMTASWLVSETASAQSRRAGADLLDAADLSFSAIPLGAPEPASGLTILNREQCDRWRECSYADAEGVEHYFWEGKLVVKVIQAAQVGDQPINALGIGDARAFNVVVSRVESFLPEAELNCLDSAGGESSCGATLGEGWISLQFDSLRRLTEVRIDAYHFI